MKYLRNIMLCYAIAALEAFIPAYVIERLFWEMRGMNVTMVVACEMIFAVVIVIIEIPTGILADRFGRKKLIVINGFLSTLELLILLFADRFFMFALAVFLTAIGYGCRSGSLNALIYDSLLAADRQASFEKVLGRLNVITNVSISIAAIIGGFLADFGGLELNYAVSVVSCLTSFLLTFLLVEPPIQRTEDESKSEGANTYLKDGFRFFKNRRLVFGYCLTGAFLAGCIHYLDEFWQLLTEGIGVPVMLYGFVLTAYCLVKIPGSLLAHRLKTRLEYGGIFKCMTGFYIIGFFAIALTRNYWCLIPMFILSMLQGIMDPLLAGCIHHNTESRIRATVESFLSLGIRVMVTAVGFLFSIFANSSIFNGFMVLGILCLAYCAVNTVFEKSW